MSALLQERLERERRAESEKSSSRIGVNDLLRSSVDSRALGSPSPSDGHPISSNDSESSRKKGLGVKEMEQILSNLHKQNFDLKLELFHRRERQTALEDRLEKVEKEKVDTEAMNERLLHELEKRDKAVEEAVSMIVMLESRVEQLLLEREMVRQVEEQGLAYASSTSISKPPQPLASEESKELNRMPSFLSEKTENTENLRNVYLGVRGSVLSLRTTTEASPDTTRGEQRMGSPALSILSESSFISIYGQNRPHECPSHADSTHSKADNATKQRLLSHESPTKVRNATPKARSSSPRAVSNSYTQFHTITKVLDTAGSPLGRLEKFAVGEAARARTTANEHSPFARPPSAQIHHPKSKKEKREELERVLTEGKFGRDQGLPPTPDTISTTTLRLYKDSNDTLSKEQALSNERSYLALSDTTISHHSAPNELATGLEPPRVQTTNTQAASTTAFDSRKPFSSGDTNFEPHASVTQIKRPKTAAQTSRDHRRFDWDGDDSGDDHDHADDSGSSSVDTWLRESMKPGHPDGLGPMSSVSQANPGFKNSDRVSPDLFSFPVSTKGWATNAMFGTLGGAGYVGAAGRDYSATPTDENMDATVRSLPTPVFSSGLFTQTTVAAANPAPPPPPNRRSSLLAKTTAEGPISTYPAKTSPPSKMKKDSFKGNRARSNSTEVQLPPRHLTEMGMKQDRAMTVPPKQVYLPPQPPKDIQSKQPPQNSQPSKQRHYPPTASQGAAVRPRSRGLSNFFRRSTGSADPPLVHPSSAPPTETTFRAAAEKNGPGIVGMPSWVRRNSLVDDERGASATPPPIQRNRNPERRVEFDDDVGGVVLEPVATYGTHLGDVPLSDTKDAPSRSIDHGEGVSLNAGGSVPPSAGGGKRRWLGLGRRNSIQNRGGS